MCCSLVPRETPDGRQQQANRERQLWIEFVRKREAGPQSQDGKPTRKRRSKTPQPTPAELEAALDELVREADSRGVRVR